LLHLVGGSIDAIVPGPVEVMKWFAEAARMTTEPADIINSRTVATDATSNGLQILAYTVRDNGLPTQRGGVRNGLSSK